MEVKTRNLGTKVQEDITYCDETIETIASNIGDDIYELIKNMSEEDKNRVIEIIIKSVLEK